MQALRLCLLLCVAGTAEAQVRPDFSGRWILASPGGGATNVADELVVRESYERPSTILTVERRSKSGVRSDIYRIGLQGGTVGGVAASGQGQGPGGQVTRTTWSVTWDGDRLVIETGSYSGLTRSSGPYSERMEIWSLDGRGSLVMTITDRASGTDPRVTELTYRRP